jgi:UDP-N-acetylmuramoyl-tripeptide--D-alanyl-D-alanine ligase
MCRLTPPHFGVLTAIGEAHYERFKSLDTVARAKFELPTAALSTPNGLAVIHTSVLAQPYAKAFVDQNRARFVLVGPEEFCDARILEATQTVKGLQVVFSWKGETHTINAPLFGQHNIGNLVLGFATAACLGVAPERILQSLRTAPQTRHRLEVKRQPGGAILIDDAYNSNPLGFEAALDILTLLAEGKRRRVLVTPGMTELGATHDAYHSQLGTKAATRADVVIVVRPSRIPTFVSALRAAPNGPEVLEMESFAAARAWLGKHSTDTDVVLLENDLPDLYERKLVL